MDEDLRQKVADKIKDAFSETPYPGDDNIGGDAPEGDFVEEDFRGKHWHDITLEMLLHHHDKLPFFAAPAFRFYLPAYLVGVLFHFEDLDMYFIPARLFKVLAPPSDYKAGFLRIANQFTAQEKAAIHYFLTSYKVLFPEESWSYIDEEGEHLEAAIAFWKD